MSKKKDGLQEKIEKLEALAERVENGDISINEIMEIYKESAALVKSAKEEVQKIQNEILIVENES